VKTGRSTIWAVVTVAVLEEVEVAFLLLLLLLLLLLVVVLEE